MRVAPDEVMLNLTLTAASNDDDISFPLDVGVVTVEVTFAGENFERCVYQPRDCLQYPPGPVHSCSFRS